MKKTPSPVSLLGLCVALLLPNAAKAAVPTPPATFTIDDTSAAETITVTWSGFINSVLLNNVVQPADGSLTFNENVVNTINFSGMWNSGGLAIAPTYVDFYENGPQPIVSDHLTYSVGTGPGISTFILDFTSDVEGGAPLLPRAGASTFVEGLDPSGSPLAYQYTYNTLQPLTFSVVSAPEVIPEPSTLTAVSLLGLPFLLQGIRRQRHRA